MCIRDRNYNAFCPVSLEPERETYGLNHTLYATPMVEILRDAGYHTIHVGKAHWGPAGTPGSNPYNKMCIRDRLCAGLF